MKNQETCQSRQYLTGIIRISLVAGITATGIMMWSSPIQAENKLGVAVPGKTQVTSTVMTGRSGTCEWTFQNGILKIGAGNYQDNSSWRKYADQIQEIQFTGKVVFPEQSYGLFKGLRQLRHFTGTAFVDTSQVTNMGAMFQFDNALESLDLRSWDVRQVKGMRNMFSWTKSLRELHVETWKTAQVAWMQSMFMYCGAHSLDLRQWSVDKVSDLSGMFFGMSYLTSLDLRGWQTQRVTSLFNTFAETPELTNLQLGDHWDTSQVTNLSGTFEHTGLRSLDLRGWDVRRVITMASLFWNCYDLESIDFSGWQTGNVTNMGRMFRHVPAKALPIDDWDVSHVTDMSQMLAETGAQTLDLHKWNVRQVVNFEQLFAASQAENINVSGWQTSHAGSMQKMFYRAQVTALDLREFDMTHLDYRDDPYSDYWDSGRVELMLGSLPNLHVLQLGPKNLLKDANGYTVGLSSASDDNHDNDLWQAVGTGTIAKPQGSVLTIPELEDHYTPTMAGTYVRKIKAAPVFVSYSDLDTGEIIQAGQTLNGFIGEVFTIGKNVPGYQYQRASGPLTGKFGNHLQTITLYYLKTTSKLGSVTFEALDDIGNRVSPDVNQTGKIGNQFPIVAPVIPGYRVHLDAPLPAMGVFTVEPQVIRFLYRQWGKVRVWYIDEAWHPILQAREFEGEAGTDYRVEQFTMGLESGLAGFTFLRGIGMPGKYGAGEETVALMFKKNSAEKPGPTPTPTPTPLPTSQVNSEKPAQPIETVENGGNGDLITSGVANQASSKPAKQRRKSKKVVHQQSHRGRAADVATDSAKRQRNQALPATGETVYDWRIMLSGLLLAALSWQWWWQRRR